MDAQLRIKWFCVLNIVQGVGREKINLVLNLRKNILGGLDLRDIIWWLINV